MSDKVMELTNEVLKGIMTDAMVERVIFTDLDETKDPGIYRGGGADSTGTIPTSDPKWYYGVAIVMKSRQGTIQILFSNSLDVAIREFKNHDSTWCDYRILQFV